MSMVLFAPRRLVLATVGLIVAVTLPNLLEARAASTLDERLVSLLASHQGRVAMAVEHLQTGERFEHNAEEPMPTASLIKVPVMVEAYRQADEGCVDLDAIVTLKDSDKVPGSGILTPHFSEGASFSMRDAIRLMIVYSDNTATNLVLDQIGLGATAETMERLGFPNTKIHAKVFRRDTSVFPERSERFGLGSTTASEMVRLLGQLHRGEVVSPEASEAMLAHMERCDDRSMFPRFLPRATRIAHKTGAVSDVRTSGGILHTPGGPVALCVLTADNDDRRWSDDNAAARLVAEVAREVYNHFNRLPDDNAEVASESPISPTVKLGDSGPAVENLQRLLNARLDPTPGLAVDGAFGPLTEAALIRFQRANFLEPNGVADAPTWETLGPLPDAEDEPDVPDPETVNAETPEKEPPDDLDGPPFVTAKAWAVADARTGALLGSANEAEPLDMASTTKIMTALVVLRLAERDPDVLDEVVTFSERADQTTGSSAGIQEGERLPVRELLYGLMLPSGNDASVALAEHFGHRLGPPDDDPHELDPLPRFVAEMNRVAAELGLDETRYANPHGLTDPDHRTSARDLVTLAHHALGNPAFAEYVATVRRGATLIDPEDNRRNIVWTNTNQLLAIEGYDGVKTGTTRAAGACLVSSGRRGDDHRIVVVLGSSSADARYTDTRNLFRWIWLRRGHGSAEPVPEVGADAPPDPDRASATSRR